MHIAIAPSRIRFERLTKELAESVYADEYIKEQYRNDLYQEGYRDNPDFRYFGAYIDSELVGMFCCIDITVIEIEVHPAFFKDSTIYSREVCKEFVRWMFEVNNIYRITTLVMDFRRTAVNLALKIGFKYEGMMNKCAIRDGVWYGKHILGITRS